MDHTNAKLITDAFLSNFFSIFPLHWNLLSFMVGAFWAATFSYYKRYVVFGFIVFYVCCVAAYYGIRYYLLLHGVSL